MKKYILMSLFASLSLNGSEVHDLKIKKIKEERPSVSKTKLETTAEPFAIIKKKEDKKVIVVPEKVVEESNFVLNAIINKSAYINGKWHQVGDIIEGFTLGYVGAKGVVLRKENIIKKIFLNKTIKNNIEINLN